MADKFEIFILITTDLPKVKEVSNLLLEFPMVENVHELYGRFDIITKIVGKDQVEVEKFVSKNIRSVAAIDRTETLVVSNIIKEIPNGNSEEKKAEAYMLVNIKYGKKKDVAKKLAKFDEIERVHELYGQYDVLIKIKTRTPKMLEDFIQKNIRSIKHIEETETLIVADVPI